MSHPLQEVQQPSPLAPLQPLPQQDNENKNETEIGIEVPSPLSVPDPNVTTPRRANAVGKSIKAKSKENCSFAPFEKAGSLTRGDVTCPICLSIMIEPVTFPCKHSLCKECYGTHVRETSLYCPICRCRLSVWSRKATKENCLIHDQFWDRIKQDFPAEVEARLTGEDSQDDQPIGDTPAKDGTVAIPGEIRKEFDTLITQFEKEVEKDRLKELEATNKFLRQLEEEEGPPIELQLQSDFELAKRLEEEEEENRRSSLAAIEAERQRREALPSPSTRPSLATTKSRFVSSGSAKRKSGSSSFAQGNSKRSFQSNDNQTKTTTTTSQLNITTFFGRISTPAPERNSIRSQETVSENFALGTGTGVQIGTDNQNGPHLHVARSTSDSTASSTSSPKSTATIVGPSETFI